MSRVFAVEMMVYCTITVEDQDVLDRITGDGGEEWRSRFYDLHTAEDVAEHLAFNAVTNGVHDVRRLEGWADVESDRAVTVDVDNTDFHVEEVIR